MTEAQPDVEIYLKRVPVPDILRWLESHFEVIRSQSDGEKHEIALTYRGESLSCFIVEKVVKGGYVSVWFRENKTPWATDEACARNAFETLGAETRCSVGGWEPVDDESGADEQANEAQSEKGGWYRFTESGQSIVNWLT